MIIQIYRNALKRPAEVYMNGAFMKKGQGSMGTAYLL